MSADRPRDRLGRPVSGDSPHVDPTSVPDVTTCTDAEVWQIVMDFLVDGRPFHAHEVCEDRWRVSSGPQREAWRALAQWGAAETHQARGNRTGAQRLAERALVGLHGCDAPSQGVDFDFVRERCRTLLAE